LTLGKLGNASAAMAMYYCCGMCHLLHTIIYLSLTSFFFSAVSALYTAALYLSDNNCRVVSRSSLLFLSDLANTTCTLWPVPYCVLLLALTELKTMWL
ncbi:hypothetical protein V8C86DRAFT_2876045, partial [Haematococcus lacustris]